MASKPTLVYTWALSGTATAPTLGKQASGWAVGERPPAPTENWLNQANGEWITYLDDAFIDVVTSEIGGGNVTTAGLRLGKAEIGVSTQPASGLGITTLSVQSSSSATAAVESDILRARGRVEFSGNNLLAEPALRLDPARSPSIAGPHAVADWEVRTAGGGKVIVIQGAVGIEASASEIDAAGIDADEALCLGNLIKAHCEVKVTLSGGVFSVALEGAGYNVGTPTYPTTAVLVPVTDNTNVVGQIRAAVRQTTGSTSVLPFAISGLIWNAGAGRIEFVPQQLTGGAWQPFHTPATPAHEIVVSLTLY